MTDVLSVHNCWAFAALFFVHDPLKTMTVWQLTLHLFNFVLPALALALFMPLAGRWVMGPSSWSVTRRVVAHSLVGTGVLVVGLVVQGHDGTMASYMALVVVVATLEWLMHGWRPQR